MKKNLIIALAVAGFAISACGKKASYRSHKTETTVIDHTVPEVTEEKAEESVAQKAEALVLKDEVSIANGSNTFSESLRSEILGVSLTQQIEHSGQAYQLTSLEISILTNKDQSCLPQKTTTQRFSPDQLNRGVSIANLGRLVCIDKDCNNMVLFIEKKISDMPSGSLPQEATATVPVLLSRSEDGTFRSVATESGRFINVGSAEAASDKCLQDLSAALKTQRQQRLVEISARITVIDAEIRTLENGGAQVSIETLATRITELNAEKAELQRERINIQSHRSM